MQYPYLVFFADAARLDRYLVRANDKNKARARATRKYQEDPSTGTTGELVRLAELTPKQQDGEFLPRIDGVLVSSQRYATQSEAVDASIKFLDDRRTKT